MDGELHRDVMHDVGMDNDALAWPTSGDIEDIPWRMGH
jgi:hypothetical protein